MNGKDLLISCLKNETTTRPAWVPFVGVHGGFLQGVSARDYLQSADLIVEGLKIAKQRYRPDGLPLVFDLQLEAEVLGCDLNWAEDAPPAVTTHPLADKELTDFDSLPAFSCEQGRFPLVKDVIGRTKSAIGEDTALYGLITGPFTLALHLRGNDIFLDMFDDEEDMQALMGYCAEVGKQVAEFYLDNGADVIAVVDPMTSQISPEHFEQFVSPYVNTIFQAVRAKGGYSSMFVCGNATRNLENMCKTEADNVSIDENISLEYLREIAQANGKSFGGNLKLTVVLLMGDVDDAKADTLRCLDAGGETGFVLAPGCDLPYSTPPENIEAVAELLHDPYQRDIARQTAKAAKVDSFDDIEVPDYASGDKLIIDVVTLNSDGCAPCYYMLKAAQDAAASISPEIEVHERKINCREGLAYMTKLGVAAIPTICIGGEPSFASIIPDQPTLIEAINKKRPAGATA